MKNFYRSAMLAMVFAAAVTATSCQKDKEKEESTEKTVSHFNPANLQIDDMNAYLEGFKEKMENAEAKGTTETMGLEEAAWHLSSVANHDFANIGAPHDTLRFDTLYCHVDVTDGMVSVADMNAAYEEMSQAIVNFKKGLACDNPNFWFIRTIISENGDIIVPLTTMFCKSNGKYWGDHYWFFDAATADSICHAHITSSVTYWANNNAENALQYALYLKATTSVPQNGYLVDEFTHSFLYQNHTDPYYSHFRGYSRLYASSKYAINPINYSDMCYAFDSYAGLATNYYTADISAIDYFIRFKTAIERDVCVGNHKMTVYYGRIVMHGQDPGGGGSN